jgi:hypothetical protein
MLNNSESLEINDTIIALYKQSEDRLKHLNLVELAAKAEIHGDIRYLECFVRTNTPLEAAITAHLLVKEYLGSKSIVILVANVGKTYVHTVEIGDQLIDLFNINDISDKITSEVAKSLPEKYCSFMLKKKYVTIGFKTARNLIFNDDIGILSC